MNPPFIGAEELARLLSIDDAIAALDEEFRVRSGRGPDRSHIDVGSGVLLVMPAFSEQGAGVKLVTVAPDDPARELPLVQGLYVLFEQPSLRPVVIFDAAPLTALRTAAVSAVATSHLAPPDASDLLVFGAGVQARAHVRSMAAVRTLTKVTIVSRTRARAEEAAAEAAALGFAARVGRASDVTGADLICTCTTSSTPLFDGGLVAPGTHVNAIGSYRPADRELDDELVARARVVIDTKAALRESGDLVTPLNNGSLKEEEVVLLSDAVGGSGPLRSGDDITVFKSVGAAFEDLAVATAAACRL